MVGGFAALILLGTLVLLLPWSRSAGPFDPVDALFISTSAVCVTGLSTVDFPVYFSGVGQGVVLLLIQIGGLGVMTGAALVYRAVGRRLSLRSQAALQDSLLQADDAHGFRRVFRSILVLVFTIEAVGFVVLFAGLLRDHGVRESFSSALFHAVSAFCNAGFSTYSDNLAGFQGRPLVLGAVMVLIVLGGLGGVVLVELRAWARAFLTDRRRRPRLSMHTRTVLVTSAILIIGGTLLLLAFGLSPDEQTAAELVEGALFQSVTARTAGFNSIAIGALPEVSLLLLTGLMFIGGSPASCAGGVKTTTAAIWGAELWSALRRREETVIFGRAVPPVIIRRAMLLINLSIVFNVLGVLILMLLERGQETGPMAIVFEQVSAFGTVGLSTGITPLLSDPAKLWLVVTMFVGRLGPLVLAAFALRAHKANIHHATGKILLG